MTWRLARSLETLRAEVNGYAPKRSKASDGTIGDPAHASRASRHNENRYHVVTAVDITHDPAGGCDIHAIARRLVRVPHPELEYVISDGEVAKRRNKFRWEPYRGTNAHRKHAHFAVGTGPDNDPLPPYDSTLSWGVSLPPEDDMPSLKDIEKLLDEKLKPIKVELDAISERQVPENTVRADIILNRKIAGKVGVPVDQIPKP